MQGNPTRQNGFIIFNPAGVNQYENAVIWIEHCYVQSNGELAYAWIQESPVLLPNACTGWIYGWQCDAVMAEIYQSIKCRGFMADNGVLYQSGIKTYARKRLPHTNVFAGKRQSLGESLEDAGIIPTTIVNPEIFQDQQGNINFERFGTDGDEIVEIDINPLNDLLIGSTGRGFAIRNNANLTLHITLVDVMGRTITQILDNQSEVLTWEESSIASGTYIVQIQHGNYARAQQIIIL
jgi:hypothetical protein